MLTSEPEISDEAKFKQTQLAFQAEIINALAQHTTLTLDEVMSLHCFMRVGSLPKEIPITGPVDFRVIAAMLHSTSGRPDRLKLRIEPKRLEEFRYAEIFVDKHMSAFSGTFKGTKLHSWEVIYEAMLEEIEPTSKFPYGKLVDLAVNAERLRINKANIKSHDQFGTW